MATTYKIGEAAALLNLKTYVLRFWETEFPEISPLRTAKGQRLYTAEHLALLDRIRYLLHDRGLTIGGARKVLDEERNREVVYVFGSHGAVKGLDAEAKAERRTEGGTAAKRAQPENKPAERKDGGTESSVAARSEAPEKQAEKQQEAQQPEKSVAAGIKDRPEAPGADDAPEAKDADDAPLTAPAQDPEDAKSASDAPGSRYETDAPLKADQTDQADRADQAPKAGEPDEQYEEYEQSEYGDSDDSGESDESDDSDDDDDAEEAREYFLNADQPPAFYSDPAQYNLPGLGSPSALRATMAARHRVLDSESVGGYGGGESAPPGSREDHLEGLRGMLPLFAVAKAAFMAGKAKAAQDADPGGGNFIQSGTGCALAGGAEASVNDEDLEAIAGELQAIAELLRAPANSAKGGPA